MYNCNENEKKFPWIEELQDKRIILYGLGENTKIILTEYPNHNFLALMDPKEEGGTKWGKRIVSVHEMVEMKPDVVIIVARKCFEQIIYSRISVQCSISNIKVLNLEGNICDASIEKKTVEQLFGYIPNNDRSFYAQKLIQNKCDTLTESNKEYFIIRNDYELGYVTLGALLAEFVLHIAEKSRADEIDTILFGSRDGYVLYELYTILKNKVSYKLPDAKYLYTSRMACVMSNIGNPKDIEYAISLPFSGTIEEMLMYRFDIKSNIVAKQDNEDALNYVLKYEEQIVAESLTKKENYMKYIKSIDIGRNAMFVDFSASGTCQLYLEKLLNRKLRGMYLRRVRVEDNCKNELFIESLYPESIAGNTTWAFEREYIALEGIVTSYEPTVVGFDNLGDPVFLREKRSAEEINVIKEIHKGIMDYFNEYTDKYIEPTKDIEFVDKTVGLIEENKYMIHSKYLKKAVLRDEFANREFAVADIIAL